MNRVILVGRLGQDPESRTTSKQASVVNLNLATSERRKNATGVYEDQTEWHKIVVWNETADNVKKYLRKGSKILVEGKIATRKWTNKDGATQYTTEIIAQNVQFLDSKPGAEPAGREEARRPVAQHEFDSIPF